MDENGLLANKIRARRGLPAPALRRVIRESAGATQEDIAAEVGVNRVTVSRWESGQREPSGLRLVRYSALLRDLQGRT